MRNKLSNERLSFDLTSSDLETGFKLAPAGWAAVEIDDVQEQDSSNGNPQYVVYYKSTDEKFTGTIRDYVTITKASINNMVNLAKVTGFPVPSKETGGSFEIPEADDLIGKELEINIIHVEDRNGKTDDDGNVVKYANVKFAGRRTLADAKATGKKPAAKAKGKAAGGFEL